MADDRKFGLVGHDFAKKNSAARVTGMERYTVDDYYFGVASGSTPFARTPVSEVI